MASLPNTVARFDGTPEPYKLDQDRKRDLDHRSKYALGAVVRLDGDKPNMRAIQPAKILPKIRERRYAAWRHKGHPRYGIRDRAIITSEKATDFDSAQDSFFTAPDADIAFSYDSVYRSSGSNDVFSAAVNKAVERFETKETEKLIKNEYCVLGNKDYEADEAGRANSSGDNDSEFEWV